MPILVNPGAPEWDRALRLGPITPGRLHPGRPMRLARAGVRNPALRIVLAVLPVLALASACQASGSGSSGATGPLTVAVVPGIDNAPLRVAVQEGLFRQQGLDVTIKNYPSLSAELQGLTSGQAQIAAGDYTSFFYVEVTCRTAPHTIAHRE